MLIYFVFFAFFVFAHRKTSNRTLTGAYQDKLLVSYDWEYRALEDIWNLESLEALQDEKEAMRRSSTVVSGDGWTYMAYSESSGREILILYRL